MGKTHAQRDAERRAADRMRAEQAGDHFSVVWTIDALTYGPKYHRTRAAAEQERDAIIAQYEQPIPMEYYDRQASLQRVAAWLRVFRNGAWADLEDSRRECTGKVTFHD